MIELRQHRKDMDFTPYDYVFEDVKKFEDVLPFLLPKLDGEWHILLVEPKPSYIRTYLDTSVIPSYIHLLITVEPNQLEQLYLERPNLVEKERTNWDVYMDLIKEFPVPMDDKAMRELYYRAGPKEESLRAALNELMDYPDAGNQQALCASYTRLRQSGGQGVLTGELQEGVGNALYAGAGAR